MKKISLLLFATLVVFCMQAQEVQNVSHGTVYLRNRGADNWFMQLGGGTNMWFNAGENNANAEFMERLGWNGQLAIGRWNSPNWGARFVIDAGHINFNSAGRTAEEQQWIGGQLHLMYNLMNAWGTYRPDRVWSLIPFGGVGYMYGLNDWARPNPDNGLFYHQNQAFTFNAGLINQFQFSPGFGIFIELAARMMPESFGSGGAGRTTWDSQLTASAGIQFGLGGKQTFTPAELMDYSLINDLNSQINRLRQENEQLRRRPESCPECPPVVAPPPVQAVTVPNVVFFRINSAVIDRGQQVSVFNVAEHLRQNPNARVRIAAYADRGTGTPAFNMALSERRARAVAAALEAHGIASNRISIEWHGDTVQPFAENDWNRVAIFFIE